MSLVETSNDLRMVNLSTPNNFKYALINSTEFKRNQYIDGKSLKVGVVLLEKDLPKYKSILENTTIRLDSLFTLYDLYSMRKKNLFATPTYLEYVLEIDSQYEKRDEWSICLIYTKNHSHGSDEIFKQSGINKKHSEANYYSTLNLDQVQRYIESVKEKYNLLGR